MHECVYLNVHFTQSNYTLIFSHTSHHFFHEQVERLSDTYDECMLHVPGRFIDKKLFVEMNSKVTLYLDI